MKANMFTFLKYIFSGFAGLFFCRCNAQTAVEVLSDAIVKSDIVQVRKLLQEYSLSALEKQAFLDFLKKQLSRDGMNLIGKP